VRRMSGEASGMVGFGPQAEDAPVERAAVDRSAASARGGSIGLVLLVAGCLIGAATGIVLFGRDNPESYVLIFLAALATVGVFGLFAWASGILRLNAPLAGNPLIKSIVDSAFDGVSVTDLDGRVIYANAAYLDLIGASGPQDARPVERVFIGDADASEAIFRLLKAAREGKRLQEEVRGGPSQGRRPCDGPPRTSSCRRVPSRAALSSRKIASDASASPMNTRSTGRASCG